MIRTFSIVPVAVLALVLVSTDAVAENNWSSAGSGCFVSPSYAANASVDATTGVVAFAAGATGTIKMTCPVTAWFLDEGESLDPNQLYATFTDSDGRSGTTCKIWVELIRDNVGATAGVTSITGIDDTGGGIYTQYGTSTARQQAIDPFTHTWNSTSYHYWIVVEMNRANLSNGCNMTLNGVGLYYQAP